MKQLQSKNQATVKIYPLAALVLKTKKVKRFIKEIIDTLVDNENNC